MEGGQRPGISRVKDGAPTWPAVTNAPCPKSTCTANEVNNKIE